MIKNSAVKVCNLHWNPVNFHSSEAEKDLNQGRRLVFIRGGEIRLASIVGISNSELNISNLLIQAELFRPNSTRMYLSSHRLFLQQCIRSV